MLVFIQNKNFLGTLLVMSGTRYGYLFIADKNNHKEYNILLPTCLVFKFLQTMVYNKKTYKKKFQKYLRLNIA